MNTRTQDNTMNFAFGPFRILSTGYAQPVLDKTDSSNNISGNINYNGNLTQSGLLLINTEFADYEIDTEPLSSNNFLYPSSRD